MAPQADWKAAKDKGHWGHDSWAENDPWQTGKGDGKQLSKDYGKNSGGKGGDSSGKGWDQTRLWLEQHRTYFVPIAGAFFMPWEVHSYHFFR